MTTRKSLISWCYVSSIRGYLQFFTIFHYIQQQALFDIFPEFQYPPFLPIVRAFFDKYAMLSTNQSNEANRDYPHS